MHFRVNAGTELPSFEVTPVEAAVHKTAVLGAFDKGTNGFASFLSIHDPDGPEWKNTYVGVVRFDGTPLVPGEIRATAALEAPSGEVTRFEGLDVDSDGSLELLVEIQSEGSGGYLFRDLQVLSLGAHASKVLLGVRTLEDAPGLPSRDATVRQVLMLDTDGDGTVEASVTEYERVYEVHDDLTRSLATEREVREMAYRLDHGTFKLAEK